MISGQGNDTLADKRYRRMRRWKRCPCMYAPDRLFRSVLMIQFTGDQPDAPIELWVYPGQDGSFTLYEDEGDNYNYEQGSFATIHMTWNDSTRQLTLDNRQGSYPGMQASKVFRVVIANEKPFHPLEEEMQIHEIFYEGKDSWSICNKEDGRWINLICVFAKFTLIFTRASSSTVSARSSTPRNLPRRSKKPG